MRVFLPPSDDHRKVAGSKKSHSSSEELLPQPQEQQHRHQPPPFKKKKVDQCNFSLPPSSSALAFSSGGTVMCPPSLKRGDSDGDDTGNINFNLRVGEEQHPHMQMHHHGVDNSTSIASANIIVTSSDTVNTGTCYDGFKNEALWKGSDYFDNQKQKNDGGDEGCVSFFAVCDPFNSAHADLIGLIRYIFH